MLRLRRLAPTMCYSASLNLALCLILAACNPATRTVSKAEVAALEVGVAAAERAVGLCLALRKGGCADQPTRTRLIADSHKAHDEVKKLQTASAAGLPVSVFAAQEALSILVAETPAGTAVP